MIITKELQAPEDRQWYPLPLRSTDDYLASIGIRRSDQAWHAPSPSFPCRLTRIVIAEPEPGCCLYVLQLGGDNELTSTIPVEVLRMEEEWVSSSLYGNLPVIVPERMLLVGLTKKAVGVAFVLKKVTQRA